MPGPRQPTDLLKATGRKHLSQQEEDQRRDQEVHVPPPDQVEPPKWLLKKFHKEFREIGEILGRTEVWARVRFYRGKEALARKMGGDGHGGQ